MTIFILIVVITVGVLFYFIGKNVGYVDGYEKGSANMLKISEQEMEKMGQELKDYYEKTYKWQSQ